MSVPRQGTTLIELSVVLVMIVLLSTILLPIFTRAREQERQGRCLNNSRQIATAVLCWAQDHDSTLPPLDMWEAVNLPPPTLICPDAPALRNGYVYSSIVAGKSLSSLKDSASVLLTADGAHTVVDDQKPNVAYASADLVFRHGENLLAAFADGHAQATHDVRDLPLEFRPSPAAEFAGYDTTTSGLWFQAPGRYKFGARGFVLPGWDSADPATVGLSDSFVATVTATAAERVTWAPAPCLDPRAVANPLAMGTQAADAWTDGTYTITLANPDDTAPHVLRLYCVDWDHAQRVMSVDVLNAATGASLLKQHIVLSEFGDGTWLTIRFRGNITIQTQHTQGPNAVVSAFVFD